MQYKRYRPDQTEEERERAREIRQREMRRQERYDREMSTLYSNQRCPVCGSMFMTGFICRKHRAAICERHCAGCEYFLPQFYHCMYREEEESWMNQGKEKRRREQDGVFKALLDDKNLDPYYSI